MDGIPIKKELYFTGEPYPEIRVVDKNRYYAMLLFEDYASKNSELTAIHQYLYHSFKFKDQGMDEIAQLIYGISMVETKHLEILAGLILKLGEDPRFKCLLFNDKYFSTAEITYGKSVNSMLATDIETEEKAINQYREHIEEINDPNVKAVLERIIKDEEHHLFLFKLTLKVLRQIQQNC